MGKRYKCNHCGYEGYCYGVGHAKGVSAPFCYRCGCNDKLVPIKEEGKALSAGGSLDVPAF